MRRVLVTISVQVAAMWISFHIVWDDGDAEHTGHFALWFPGTMLHDGFQRACMKQARV